MTDAAQTTEDRGPEPATGSTDSGRSRKRGRARTGLVADALAMVALVVLAVVAVLPQVLRQGPLSALDEGTHIDYAWHAARFEIPSAGDTVAPAIRELWSCYGNELAALPLCGASEPQSGFPIGAAQYNFGHPPVYYFVTGILANGIGAATGWDFITAARSTGALWLAAGMVVMRLGLRRAGVERWLATSVAAASGMWWASLGAAAIVTNDAPFLLTTAFGVLALAACLRSGGGWAASAMLVGGAALAAGVKVMNALPFLAIAGALVVLALAPDRWRASMPRWRLLVPAGGSVVAVAAVFLGWTRFQGARGVADWDNPVEGINSSLLTGAPWGEWLSTVTRGLSYLGHAYVTQGAARPAIIEMVADLASIIGLAAVAIGIAVGRRGSMLSVLALATLIGAAAWPTLVQLQTYLSSGGTHWFAAPSYRYGATTGTMALAVLALAAQRVRWHAVTIAGCVVLVGLTLVAVLLGP